MTAPMNPICKGCHKPIIWATTSEGKAVPLDPRPPVYRVVRGLNGRANATRVEEAYVSHFATCPQANDFSGSKRKAQGDLFAQGEP